MTVTKELEEKLRNTLEKLSDYEPDSKEREQLVKEARDLADALAKLKQVDVDDEDKYREYCRHLEETEETLKNDRVKVILAGAEIVVFVAMGLITLNFDKTSSVTSTLGKTILGKCLPKR